IFHYALKDPGFLMLGVAETVGPLADFFSVVDKKYRVYAKKPTSRRFDLGLTSLEQRLEKIGIGRTAGRTGEAGGGPSDLKQDVGLAQVTLEVIPVSGPARERNYLVLFESVPPSGAPRAPGRAAPRGPRQPAVEHQIKNLHQELTATKEFLQSIIQEREAANEELQAANEELQSSNEELQSTNEELETAKEELQSVNEELTTVNEELQHRNADQSLLNNDLN